MMKLQIFFVYLMICGSWGSDLDLFDSLYESQDEGGKGTACAYSSYDRSLVSCPGVFWRHSWLLARASCLKYTSKPIVQKGTATCTQSNSSVTPDELQYDEDQCTRDVTAMFRHPKYPIVDLAILRLNYPVSYKARAFNHDIEQELDEWEKSIAEHFTTTNEDNKQLEYYEMYTSPLKMFAITVLVPFLLFILFFLYVILYTGTPDKPDSIHYTNLINKEM